MSSRATRVVQLGCSQGPGTRVTPPLPRSSGPSLGKSVTWSSRMGSNTRGQKCSSKLGHLKGWWLFVFVLCFKICLVFCPVTSKDDDNSLRRAPPWRKTFRPQHVCGSAAACAESLPANRRVPSSLSPPSGPCTLSVDGVKEEGEAERGPPPSSAGP